MLGIGLEGGGVGRVHDLRPEPGLGPSREGVAEERLDLRADVQQRRVGRERVLRRRLLVGDHGRVLDDLPEALLCHADALGRLHALADVQDDALPVRGRVVGAADEDGLLVDPDGVAVRGDHPIVHRERGAGCVGPCAGRQHVVDVIGMDHVAPALGAPGPERGRIPEHVDGVLADVVDLRGLGRPGTQALRVHHRRHPLDEHAEPLLGFAEALLGGVTRRDVHEEPLEERELALLVEDGTGGVLHPDPVTVGVAHPVFLGHLVEIRDAEVPRRAHRREIVGVHDLEPEAVVLHEALGGVAEDLFHLRADEGHLRVQVIARDRLVDVGDRGQGLDHRPIPVLRHRARGLCLDACGDVDEEPLEVPRVGAVLARHRRRRVVHPDPVAVGVAHPILLVERVAGGAGVPRGLVDARLIVGMHEVEPGVGIGQELVGRVAEQRLDLGTEERHAHPLGTGDVDVGHGGDPLDDAAVARLGVAQTLLLAPPCDRRAQQRGRGTDAVEVREAPRPRAVTVLEAETPPPFAVDRDRVVGEGLDPLQRELRLLVRREGRDVADDRLARGHGVDPALELGGPGRAAQAGVIVHRGDPGRAPFRFFGGEGRPARVAVRADDGRAGDAGGDPEAGEHLVDRLAPIGRDQHPFGGEGDGLQDGVTAQRRRS